MLRQLTKILFFVKCLSLFIIQSLKLTSSSEFNIR